MKAIFVAFTFLASATAAYAQGVNGRATSPVPPPTEAPRATRAVPVGKHHIVPAPSHERHRLAGRWAGLD
jgi:hypothetical protein